MTNNYQKLTTILGKERVLLNEPLSKYSTFRIGGSSDLFFSAKTIDEIIKADKTARSLNIPFFIIGGGTNLLISDSGFRGLVIKNQTSTIKLVGIRGKKTKVGQSGEIGSETVYISSESGVGVNRLVRFTIDIGLSGLEYFLGQPGSVGGAVYINAHNMNMGKFFGDAIVGAKILKSDGSVVDVPASYFKFGYDQSVVQKTGDVVLSVIFHLQKGEKQALWDKAQRALEYRKKTQPLGVFSSGCTFRNIKKSDAVRIATPDYTCSAGYLLDRLNFKGERIGDAQFSDEHANFILNRGRATATDVLSLINLAKKKVSDNFGVNLKEEIVLVGEFDG